MARNREFPSHIAKTVEQREILNAATAAIAVTRTSAATNPQQSPVIIQEILEIVKGNLKIILIEREYSKKRIAATYALLQIAKYQTKIKTNPHDIKAMHELNEWKIALTKAHEEICVSYMKRESAYKVIAFSSAKRELAKIEIAAKKEEKGTPAYEHLSTEYKRVDNAARQLSEDGNKLIKEIKAKEAGLLSGKAGKSSANDAMMHADLAADEPDMPVLRENNAIIAAEQQDASIKVNEAIMIAKEACSLATELAETLTDETVEALKKEVSEVRSKLTKTIENLAEAGHFLRIAALQEDIAWKESRVVELRKQLADTREELELENIKSHLTSAYIQLTTTLQRALYAIANEREKRGKEVTPSIEKAEREACMFFMKTGKRIIRSYANPEETDQPYQEGQDFKCRVNRYWREGLLTSSTRG
ncbi:MAG TPA: hypothetical protein VNC84_02825 [Gammaproteobacteria bacterium]|jgi:hypothetical protein|nr:hypothetical protein [Gammaproteobacteria bacterium]